MRRFLLKFLIPFVVFFTLFGIYKFYIVSECTGDLGRLGYILFGKECGGVDCVPWYNRPNMPADCSVDVYLEDSLALFPVITLGDSFCQQKENGWQRRLGHLLGCTVANYPYANIGLAPHVFFDLCNAGYLHRGQTVIVETVERNALVRFNNLPSNDKQLTDTYIPVKETSLNRFLTWVRSIITHNHPGVLRYKLNRFLFSHTQYPDQLFVHKEDLNFRFDKDEEYIELDTVMCRLTRLADSLNIRLIFMIAADKYDCYSPWIIDDHPFNPSMSRIPDYPNVFKTLPCLRESVENGVRDVYKVNDSHWSIVGADIVADRLYDFLL